MTALLLVCGLVVAVPVSAQSLGAAERQALSELHTERGGSAAELDVLLRSVDGAAARDLPTEPLLNKIREGYAKGVAPARIPPVIQQMAADLATADQILRTVFPEAAATPNRTAVTLLAEALGGGVTAGETREISRLVQEGGRPSSPDVLAGAAKALALIKDARLPVADGTRVVVAAARSGFRPVDLLDLGRDIKQRETLYQEDVSALRALGDAITRGERPERLFRDAEIERVERPAPTRPEAPVDRPVRPEPVERPDRPEVPQRPRG